MELNQLTAKIQVKFNQFTHKQTMGFPLPLRKFVRQMEFGILKSGSVQLNSIGQALQEKIRLKKTTKRLGYHLGVVGLWKKIMTATLRAQRSYLHRCCYLILDISDIRKTYAKKMAGLARVHDGSRGELGDGYWQCNVTGVDKSGALLVPAYSELYSLGEEVSSENAKILSAIDSVREQVNGNKIWVLDRGGDRYQLMKDMLDQGQYFIIRQVGNRDLYVNGTKQPLKQISRKVKLTETYQVVKRKHNREVKATYHCGAQRVRLTPNGPDLWLVVIKMDGGGYCWLLCYLPEQDKKKAIEVAFRGYGLRWKIEEVHRQIKVDYGLEKICLQRYEALKTMNALLWSAVSFLYTRLESFSVEIITHVELALVNRKKWSDLLRFVYYKLANALKRLLAHAKLYNPITFESEDIGGQLCFQLNGT